jgi:hypothetical protein
MSSRRSSGNVAVVIGTSAGLPSTSKPNLVARARLRQMRSVARFRAVLINQARGLLGTPSRGHRSAAIANASCAAVWPGRGPIPRGRPDRASLPIHLRGADLDGAAIACCRHAGGHLDGRVEVVGLQDEPAATASFMPTNGPSVVRVLPPSTRTVVAFSGRAIGSPGVTPCV